MLTEIYAYKYVVTAILIVVPSFILSKIWKWYDESSRIKSLGGYAPPIPSKYPFGLELLISAILDTIHNRERERSHWFSAHGPDCQTVETRLGGPLGMRFIFSNDPMNVKAILATQFEEYEKGDHFHNIWRPLLGDGIFVADGETWKASRQLIRTQFIKERVSDLAVFEKHVQVLIEGIRKVGEGKELDMFEWFQRYTLDAATEFLFGRSLDTLLHPDDEFARAFGEVQRLFVIRGRVGFFRHLIPGGSVDDNLRIIHAFVDPFIEEVLALSSEELEAKSKIEYTFLHSLAAFTQDRMVLRDQIIAVLLAGRDTTGSALSWTFYELGRHPEVVNKLRAEIIDTIGLNKTPTYTELKNMKYLQHTISETLRLYPSVPFNVRVASKDTTLPRGGGPNMDAPIGLLKGNLVLYSSLAFHRHHSIYPEGEDITNYNPDRWNTWQPKPWSYIPFNGGPRICVGQQFAIAELGYTIVRLLQEFDTVVPFMDYELHKKTGFNLKTGIVLQPRDGVIVGFRRS